MKLSKNKIKRIMLSLICILLTVSTLSACQILGGSLNGQQDTTKNLDGGTNIAKLLLANKRLNSEMLDNDNIFASGSQTLKALAKKADSRRSDAIVNSNKKLVVGSFNTSNGQATWSDFDEYNNSYSYFENITGIIVDSALRGAQLIDEVKENVDTVDTWIKIGNEKYYLSVDKSSETLCKVDDVEVKICKRYTDTNGKTVYEIYIEQDFVYERIKYIPGERYELTQMIPSVDQELYFVADHSKGYWETFTSNNGGGDNYNVMYTIMKNDICYGADYNLIDGSIVLSIMSADTKTDMFTLFPGTYSLALTLKFQGFNGISKIVAPASDADENGNLTSYENATLYFTNGKTLKVGDTFANGKVSVYTMHADGLADAYMGSIDMTIEGDTEEERWNNFSLFLDETGLKCKRDWNTVYSGMQEAVKDAESLVKYYQWNGFNVDNVNDIKSAVKAEAERIAEIKKIYTDIADSEVVTKYFGGNDIDYAELDFAGITGAEWSGVEINGRTVSISSASLSVSDVRLFEKGKSYSLTIAIVAADSEDMVIVASGDNKTYEGGTPFSVGATEIRFELPDLADGTYTVAAFISTDDGIRVSYGKLVEFDSVSQSTLDGVGQSIDIEKKNDRSLVITYSATEDHEMTLQSVGLFGYAEIVDAISTGAFVYGTPKSDKLEKLVGGEYVTVSSDSDITDGKYRMAYVLKNGSSVVSGYVYVDYSYVVA